MEWLYVLVPLVLIGGWLLAVHIRIVTLSNLVRESWAQIGVQLQRRYDLVPNLVETVKGYALHEQEVFRLVTQARSRAMRSQGPVEEQSAQELKLVSGLRSLLAVAEAYPGLKADSNFKMLQQELVDTEDRIAAARRFYNANVRDYNVMVQSFPTSFVAALMGASTQSYWEVEEIQAREPVDVEIPHT